MTDQLIIKRTMRIDCRKYIEYVWVTEDDVIFPDPTELGEWSEPLAAFIIEAEDDNNARYIVKARTPTFSYVQCYSGQTVCECKEFIEAYINEPVTQEIMKLSHKKDINYKGAGTHWRTDNPMDD